MENYLEKVTKENGNIDVYELSWKQIIALLNMWNTNYAKRENTSFTEMVGAMLQASHLARERKYYLFT